MTCPACGSDDVARRRPFFGAIAGAILMIVGLALALPTLGLTMIVCLWGIFLGAARRECSTCGWSRRE